MSERTMMLLALVVAVAVEGGGLWLLFHYGNRAVRREAEQRREQ